MPTLKQMQKISILITEIAKVKIQQSPNLRPKTVKESIYRQWGIESLKDLSFHQAGNAIEQLTAIVENLKSKHQLPTVATRSPSR